MTKAQRIELSLGECMGFLNGPIDIIVTISQLTSGAIHWTLILE